MCKKCLSFLLFLFWFLSLVPQMSSAETTSPTTTIQRKSSKHVDLKRYEDIQKASSLFEKKDKIIEQMEKERQRLLVEDETIRLLKENIINDSRRLAKYLTSDLKDGSLSSLSLDKIISSNQDAKILYESIKKNISRLSEKIHQKPSMLKLERDLYEIQTEIGLLVLSDKNSTVNQNQSATNLK